MRLLQLQYFLEVASTENISQSARKLMISQPSLSRTLKELEQELSVALFIRNGHSLKLNTQGQLFAQQIAKILTQLDGAVDSVKEINSKSSQVITLRFETSSPMIPTLIEIIKLQVPDVKVKLVQHGLENSQLENYDFEFSTHPINGNINKLLLDEEIKVAIGSRSKLKNVQELSTSDLINENLILTELNPLRTYLESYLRSNHFKTVNPKFITSDRETLRGLIAQNMGIGFIPEKSWLQVNLANITLKKIYPNPPHRKIYLSYQASMALNPYHKKVSSAIQQYFAQL
ncbi:LysR family transcriptional regulator [Paucilactobacillus kaifaensis]|uniref:LysR family transcriptional regulator n=1 Tax=Paucilactobacillus kaifaensis TaxID=2559921 RepID=UPI0010FA58D2|nr:LysR family transcriptional regulator [Paucilactobacillus kaifaensis]